MPKFEGSGLAPPARCAERGIGFVRVPLPVRRLRPDHRAHRGGQRARARRTGHPARDQQRPVGPASQYHDYVAAGLNTLVGQAGALAADVRGGNLGAARTAWLTAHLTYERLGAAYDAFGDFDQEIDGRPDGLAGGVNTPQWTGFYRLEYGLWHGQSAAQLTRWRTGSRRRPRAAGLVAQHGDRPARHRAAHPRDPGERAAVPAQRPRRLRQRHHAGHHPGQHRRHPGTADHPASAAGRALRRAARRLHLAGPPACAAGAETRGRTGRGRRRPAQPEPTASRSTRRAVRRWRNWRRSPPSPNRGERDAERHRPNPAPEPASLRPGA